jgi:hypothetical protein
MLTAELYSSSDLESSIIDGIKICSEEMIPVIFSTKKYPWSSDDVVFADAAIYEPEADVVIDQEAENPLPVIRLVVTTLYSKQLYKNADERSAQLVAALEEVLSKDTYQIWVKLRLVYNIGLAVSEVSNIPDITKDPVLRAALDVTQARICFDDEIITDPAIRESMLTATEVLIGDSELVGAS